MYVWQSHDGHMTFIFQSDESESEYGSDKSESGLLHTLRRAQEILVIVQNEVGFLADLGERAEKWVGRRPESLMYIGLSTISQN